jgi:hypothetical protein
MVKTFIKLLFEKSWVALTIAAAITLLFAFFIPKSVAEQLPFGEHNQIVFYVIILLFLFLLVFGFLCLIVWALRKITKSSFSDISCEWFKEQELDYYWNVIDAFNDDEFKAIVQFIKSKNKPVVKTGNSLSRLYASSLVISRDVETRKADDVGNGEFKKMVIAPNEKSYMLKPDVYEILKYSQKKYKKIRNFK